MEQHNDTTNKSAADAKEFEIIVNGRAKKWNSAQINFDQLVVLAYSFFEKNLVTIYTVTYERGNEQNPRGSMVIGNSVSVKNGMVFNVTATSKS